VTRPRRKTYVALLRAVNLGSHNKISMSALRDLFAELGCEDAATYVQSGNVVFKSAAAAGRLASTLESGIERAFGINVAVLLRTSAELARTVAANPYADAADDPTKLHVTFLAAKPSAALVRALPREDPSGEFRVVGREIFGYFPKGYGRTKLTNAFFEQKLQVRATSRNWRTVTKLAELAAA
jgi:uncharacterized protein (DUF1697 family)